MNRRVGREKKNTLQDKEPQKTALSLLSVGHLLLGVQTKNSLFLQWNFRGDI